MKKIIVVGLTTCLLTISILIVILQKGSSSAPPIADAGPDQTVNEGEVVQFDGRGSYDPDPGVHWQIMTVDSTGIVGSETSISLDSNGYAHISYFDITNIALKYARWTGDNWSIETADSGGDVGSYTSIALDSSDYPHISYFNWSSADLMYLRWTGSNWSIETVDSNGNVGYYTSIALDSSDYPHISYDGSNGLKYAKWNGSNWTIQTVDSNASRYSSIALDNNNNPHISYCDGLNLKYANWTGNKWNKETIDGIGAWISGFDTSIALDSSDYAHISYSYHDDLVEVSYLKYAKWNGVAWANETVDDDGDVGYEPSIAVDSNGFTHISYSDNTNDDLKYARWTGSSWNIETLDSTGDVGRWTSIALDSNDFAHISYNDGTNGDLKYVKKAFDNIIYEWDFDTNGEIDATGPTPTYIYGDNGVYIVTLKVTDKENLSDNDTMQVTVNNVVPTIKPIGPLIVNEGIPYEFNATATDSGSDDLIFIWSWGDGTSDNISVYYNDGIGADPFPSPFGIFPFSVVDRVEHTYGESGIYRINLTVIDDDDKVTTCSTNVTVIDFPVPIPIQYVSQDRQDVILNWEPPTILGISHYLIFRSTSSTDFDFSKVWVNTSNDTEPGELDPIPLRTMWNDTNAAFPGDTNYEEQYYYTIRAVNTLGHISGTSRTVGKWTKTFPQGVSTFSLPLEPLETMNTTADYYLKDMNARYIKWMNPMNHIWMKHGDGDVNDTQMEVGKGYEVKFDNQTNYTFTGMPGAMINYDDDTGFLGFGPDTEARNLTATVDPLTGNITLNWTKPSSKGVNNQYYVLRSPVRDGFWTGNYVQLATLPFDELTYTDINNATASTQFYYMIVPVNETGVKGASTYSIGVWTEEYQSQYDTFGIPLKLDNNYTADWFCDNIPDTVGINYYHIDSQQWRWHSTRMPEGAYDPILEMTEGYQISTSSATKYAFIGI